MKSDRSIGANASDAAWDDFVAHARGGSHVQTTQWLTVRTALGATFDRVTVGGTRPEAGAVMRLIELSGVGVVGVAVAAPLFSNEEPAARAQMVERLLDWMSDERAMALIVQPPVRDPSLETAMEAHGFVPSLLSPRLAATATIDLGKSWDETMASMKSKTRYNARLGRRKGVRVEEADATGPSVLAELLEATAERQGFSKPMSTRELELITEHMTASPLARIFLARSGDETLAGALLIGYGSTVTYKRGAWNGRQGSLHPNEAMHLHMIEWSRENGYQTYDFDGIEPDVARAVLRSEPVEPTGVTRFKLNFGAEPVLRPSASVRFRSRIALRAHGLAQRGPAGLSATLERIVRRAL